MNKRQKKKKGLLLIKKTYSNWGRKKSTLTEVKEVNKVKEKKEVIELKVEEASTESVKEKK